jgi:hypothetical protein
MRFLIPLLAIMALLVFGWNQPFRDHVRALLPSAQIQPSRLAQLTERAAQEEARRLAPTPAPRDTTWMWKRTQLDRNPPKR